MDNFVMSFNDLEFLNSYIGYGNFTNTNIFFLGIEEGAGRHEIEPGVVARLKFFGRDEFGNFDNLLDGEDYRNGFSETSALSGGKKVNKVNKEYRLNEKNVIINNAGFPTLYIPARICLYLQNGCDPVWFEKSEHLNREMNNKIDGYNLFAGDDDSVLSTALVDWKPLLKNTEKNQIGDVPVYKEIDEDLYSAAYEKFKGDPKYVSLAEKRFEIVINRIIKSNAKVVMILGNKEYMKNFVNKLCPNGTKQIMFDASDKMPFGQEGYMENGTKVIWTYHPAYNIKDGRYEYFKQVAEKSIAPVFENKV